MSDSKTQNSVATFTGGEGLTMVIHVKKTDEYFLPAVFDDVRLELHRKGSPGKMTFKCYRDSILKMGYGDTIDVTWNGKQFFHGYIFTKEKSEDDIWNVTAYDQMRYLLNKDTFQYVGKKASEVIKELAEDFELIVGELQDTEYVIPKHRDPNATILDMCQTALDITLVQTGKMYVLYDDCGKLTLQEISKLHTDLYFDNETAADYRYTGTIDKDVANIIKLEMDTGQGGHKVVYAPRSNKAYQKSATRKQWGVLQHYQNVNPKGLTMGAQALANKLLHMKNRVKRTFKLQNQAGDLSIRGGSIAYLNVNIGEDDMEEKKEGQAYEVVVDSVTHKFSNNEHTMDMDLMGSFLDGPDNTEADEDENEDVSVEDMPIGTTDPSQITTGTQTGTWAGTGANTNVHEGLTAGANAWVGATMNNGTEGCAEAVGKVGSYYSPFLAQECNNNVVYVPTMVQDAGDNVIPFNAGSLEEGDVIVYGDNDHVVIYDGNGGYVGNSSSRNYVINGSNYWEMGSLTPTKIIKTSHF